MPIVLDASVALKLITPEPGTNQARGATLHHALLAPDWMLTEVASGLANKVRYEGFDPERAHVALSALPRFVAEFFPAAPLLPDALTLSLKLEHALYDCLYLVLALAQKARVLTADRAFAHSASRGGYQQHVELLTWT